ncbi:FecR family protein [Sphingomonas gei]|nr:FecR domain-containing protein [Sphingomonas gei]
MLDGNASGSGDPEILAEAGRWVVRARAGMSGAEKRAFRAWLAERGEHAAAADAVTNAWQAAPAAAARAGLTAPPRPSRVRARRDQYFARRPGPGWKVATTVLALPLLIAGTWWYTNSETLQLATGPHQRLVTTLADGSTVWLAPSSRLQAHFDPFGRQLALREGEVTLQVAHERRRFAVDVGGYRIVDRGTLFDVRLRGSGPVTVVLVEGRIDITNRRNGKLVASPLPGERVALGGTGAVRAAVDAQAAIAWHDGRVILDDCPLSAALAQFSEQGAPRVALRDSAVGRLRVSGAFAVGGMESFLSALAELHPVTWRRTPQGYEVASR